MDSSAKVASRPIPFAAETDPVRKEETARVGSCEKSTKPAFGEVAEICQYQTSPLLYFPNPTSPHKPLFPPRPKPPTQPPNSLHYPKNLVGLLGAGLTLTLTLVQAASASELLPLNEPSNALSLPTWAIHVSSVVECNDVGVAVRGEVRVRILERAVVGMVPLLGGALCACTWHFFYNSESLEVLVALQAALTVIGNATMCIAAYRIYRSSERSKNL
nr:uncharacterized protein LOC103437191 [Malus domestica]